jgi:hypothetical protein
MASGPRATKGWDYSVSLAASPMACTSKPKLASKPLGEDAGSPSVVASVGDAKPTMTLVAPGDASAGEARDHRRDLQGVRANRRRSVPQNEPNLLP